MPLKPSSIEDPVRNLEVRLKALEMEWENVYQRLRSAAGRASKLEGLSKGADEKPESAAAPIIQRRSELLTWRKRGS